MGLDSSENAINCNGLWHEVYGSRVEVERLEIAFAVNLCYEAVCRVPQGHRSLEDVEQEYRVQCPLAEPHALRECLGLPRKQSKEGVRPMVLVKVPAQES